MAIKSSYWIAFSLLIAIVVKHLYGVSFVSKLFLSVVSYIIVLFAFLVSFVVDFPYLSSWYLAFRERLSVKSILCRLDALLCRLRQYSIGCTLYSVGCICRLYVLLCRLGTMPYWSVSCKHVLCRLCTMLDQLQTYTLSVVHTTRITHLFWESP